MILSSCKQAKEGQSKEGNNSKQTLVIGAMSSMDFVPIAVAQKMGFLANHDVDVQIEKFYSANDRDAAFQSGNIDGTVIDYTGAILQNAGGIGIQLTSACNAPFGIVSTPKEKLESITSLKGKKIAVSRNTVIDFCIDMALKSESMADIDVEKVEINKIPLRFEMLMKGEISATALPDPFLSMARQQGCYFITDMQTIGYAVTGIAFSTESIENKASEIQSFYNAYNEAVDYIKTHPVDSIKDILIKDVGFSEELIPSVTLPAYTHAELPTDKDIQATIDWLKEKKLIPDHFDSSGIIQKNFIIK